MQLQEQLNKKWAPVLDHPDLPKIQDTHRRAVTAICLENVEKQSAMDAQGANGLLTEAVPVTNMATTTAVGVGGAAGGTDAGQVGVDFADPVLISMVRRAMPQLIAYDVCGVQPMSGPTGLIFALRARADNQTGDELFYNEPIDAKTGGAATTATTDANQVPGLLVHSTGGANVSAAVYTSSTGKTTVAGEGDIGQEMSFSIEKISVAAGTRALKGSYSMELQQDLRAVHGLDAEAELANILSAEILAEINREVIRKIYINAKVGASAGQSTNPGVFDLDTDSNGRWMVEKFKGLMMQIERDANAIAKGTRRGKGNIIMTSSDVASALQMAGILDYAPAMSTNLNVDEASATFAGVLNGRYKVYVDPYAASNAAEFYCVGYKGSSPMDAGIFYCPYVPLQMVRAVDSASFQPKIAFKTRYGIVANPFAEGTTVGNGTHVASNASGANTNEYYRKVRISNLM
jgi:hypothetical protein